MENVTIGDGINNAVPVGVNFTDKLTVEQILDMNDDFNHENASGNVPSKALRFKFNAYCITTLHVNVLLANYPYGCHLLDFGLNGKATRQAQVLATVHAMNIDIMKIEALTNAALNTYMLYPKQRDILFLETKRVEVKKITATVTKAPPFEKDVDPKVVEVQIHDFSFETYRKTNRQSP
ncbi:hypothetical protein ACJMK2_003839 [Sinanodonta woodiana]|uniref:Uncharacterized protein n=1 Tax=Sinanodonta woodiana TaxID=1069815 RepID=A0ABD3Y2E8_SINWO